MITLTFGQIRKRSFATGLAKLYSHDGFTSKDAYTVGKLITKLKQFEKECQEVGMKLTRKYARKNEDGTLYCPEGHPPGSFEVPEENVEAYKKEAEDLDSLEKKLEYRQLRLAAVEGARLSPDEITALEPLLVVLEEVPANVVEHKSK